MAVEWSDFKVLLALARAGSVAGAARELQVDHSTVSRRLGALEDAVGAKLAIRGGRDFKLTDEGRTLQTAAEAMERAAEHATRSIHVAKADVQGRVRVSLPPGFVPILMRLLLPVLRERHPALDVELGGDIQRVDLARGEADIAVRMARPSEPDLVARKALDCGWFVYASSAYLQAHGRPQSPADLARHRLVLYAETLHRIPPLCWMEAHRGTATATRVDNLEIACQMTLADAGIAVLPHFMADDLPPLQRVFGERIGMNSGWICYHETVRDAARIRTVVEALVGFFSGEQALFLGRPA